METQLAFFDFEKAFDKIDRQILWEILRRQGFPRHLIEYITGLYDHTKITIKQPDFSSEHIIISQGFRQGCSLSPTLFNIYIDDAMKQWKSVCGANGIGIGNIRLELLIFADGLLVIEDMEYKLQLALHKMNQICSNYIRRISTAKTMAMAFHGKESVRTKIIISNDPVQQATQFNYLAFNFSYNYGKDIGSKFVSMYGAIRRSLKERTRMRHY